MLFTKEQITNYLISNDLSNNYVCGDGTLCEMFSRRIFPDKVFGQKTLGPGMPGRVWWIAYLAEQNKFVLLCSYFDKDENPITREQFIELMKGSWSEDKINNLPAVMYTTEAQITWEPMVDGEWQATYSVATRTSGCMIAGPLSKILTKTRAQELGLPLPPTPYPMPTPTPTPANY